MGELLVRSEGPSRDRVEYYLEELQKDDYRGEYDSLSLCICRLNEKGEWDSKNRKRAGKHWSQCPLNEKTRAMFEARLRRIAKNLAKRDEEIERLKSLVARESEQDPHAIAVSEWTLYCLFSSSFLFDKEQAESLMKRLIEACGGTYEAYQRGWRNDDPAPSKSAKRLTNERGETAALVPSPGASSFTDRDQAVFPTKRRAVLFYRVFRAIMAWGENCYRAGYAEGSNVLQAIAEGRMSTSEVQASIDAREAAITGESFGRGKVIDERVKAEHDRTYPCALDLKEEPE